jgi:hypothetical protein
MIISVCGHNAAPEEMWRAVVARTARGWVAVLLTTLMACSQAVARHNDMAITGTAGVTFGTNAVRFAIAEARTDLFGRGTLGAALAYLDTERDSDELQLRLMVTPAFTSRGWSIDWRQMLTVSSQDVTRFRSRLRVARPGLLGREAISLRAFDELFVDLEGAGIVRNNIAAGIGVQLQDSCTAELYHVWVGNRVGRQADYAMLLISLRF